jgi:predicted alpha/beta-fold hydrolase
VNAALRPESRPFAPRRWQKGGHVQTLLGFAYRRKLDWPHPVEDVIVEGGEDVRLLLRASFHDRDPQRPTVVLLHGLGGWDAASYGLATGQLAWSRGWNVVRMNMRGAGGGATLCPRLYHAGLDCDLLSALSVLEQRSSRIAVVGFSLGANLTLLALGRNQVTGALRCAVAVCPPVDLVACVRSIGRPANALYEWFFLKNLRASYQYRRRLFPERFAEGVELAPRSIREWDERITAPLGGFRDADHYYADSSAGPRLTSIDRPALLLAAADDPMVPAASIVVFPRPAHVELEVTSTGGHVGFVAPSAAPGHFWAGERAMAFASRFV